MQSVRQKVRGAVGYDDIHSLDDKIRALNPILRGGALLPQATPIGASEGGFLRLHEAGELSVTAPQVPGQGVRVPSVLFKKARLYQLHALCVFRMPPDERGRKAG
jgi:hypothetical protein